MVRLLILSPYPPYPPRSGGALRIYHLLRGLAAHHTVTLLTFAPNAAAAQSLAPLRALCHVEVVLGPQRRSLWQRAWTTLTALQPDMALRNASNAYRDALERLLKNEHFDRVLVESIEMGGYGLLAKGRVGKIIFDEFNAEYLLQQRAAVTDLRNPTQPKRLLGGLYSLIQWRKLVAYERDLLTQYDQIFAVSEDDRRALLHLAPQAPIAIVPNGVESAHFERSRVAPHGTPAKTIVFTGTLDYRPNIDALHWFTQAVLPLIHALHNDAQLIIVGRNPAASIQALHNGTTINVIGEVPDVRPYIANAALYIVPMRIGGGVRLKLLEALAMQCAVVSTSMGAEGVAGLRHGEHILIADTPSAFAAAVVRLFDDPTLCQQLGTHGRALVTAQYDWGEIVAGAVRELERQ